RIVQESLTNVIRHSGAQHCTVVLNRTGDNLTIEITDDGTASPSDPRPSLAPASPPTHGPITPPGLGPASAPGRAPAPASSFRAGAGGGLAGTDHAFTDLTGTDRHLAGPTGADRGLAGPNEIGHGLTGMRERVTLLAGEFSAGPRPAGGFRVTVRIPVPA
ncbi:MAG TPA: ATP-binding protein, partial [Actinoplanes sp.]|nr:ATP-binding protein [Actinoplanes sp.]